MEVDAHHSAKFADKAGKIPLWIHFSGIEFATI